ncbi:MAG: restriction endonuclease subunit S [Pseudomonadota bacterium]
MSQFVAIETLVKDGVISLQTGPFGSQLHSYDYQEYGVPVIPTEGIKEGRIDLSVLPKVSEEKAAELARHRLRLDDVLFARRGVQATGRTARIRRNEAGFLCGTGAIRARIEDESIIDAGYFAWFLASPETVLWIREQAIGATMPNLNESIIKRIKIPLPPLPEQREIAAVLGALDDKIELNRKMSTTLEAMARAIYRSWFVDFDPVHSRSHGLAPAHMDKATAELFPYCFGKDGLPMKWEFRALSNVCNQVKKTIKPMDTPSEPFLHFSLPAFDAGQKAVREDGEKIKSNKAFVPNDAILFSRLNPRIPRIWWARTEGYDATPVASTEFFIVSSKRPIETPWLYCLLSSPKFIGDSLSRVTGTSNSHQRVPPKALAEIEVIYPEADAIEAFGKITGKWFKRIHALAEENQTLANLRDCLLPRLMSGELRVVKAQEQVEGVM